MYELTLADVVVIRDWDDDHIVYIGVVYDVKRGKAKIWWNDNNITSWDANQERDAGNDFINFNDL